MQATCCWYSVCFPPCRLRDIAPTRVQKRSVYKKEAHVWAHAILRVKYRLTPLCRAMSKSSFFFVKRQGVRVSELCLGVYMEENRQNTHHNMLLATRKHSPLSYSLKVHSTTARLLGKYPEGLYPSAELYLGSSQGTSS